VGRDEILIKTDFYDYYVSMKRVIQHSCMADAVWVLVSGGS